MPQWLLFDQFFPPTWLTPLVNAPAVAMVWAFVLSKVCDQNPDRGIVTVPGIRPGWIRFELSPAVLLGAAVFVATNLLDGMFRLAQFQLSARNLSLVRRARWRVRRMGALVGRVTHPGGERGGGVDLPDRGADVADRSVRSHARPGPHARQPAAAHGDILPAQPGILPILRRSFDRPRTGSSNCWWIRCRGRCAKQSFDTSSNFPSTRSGSWLGPSRSEW